MASFETGAEIARCAVRLHPEDLDIQLLGAAHIRRATGIGEALRFLQDSAETFRAHGGYWFAIACLHCQIGDLEQTAECTRRAVDLDRSYQMRVLDNVDLDPLRASWCWEK